MGQRVNSRLFQNFTRLSEYYILNIIINHYGFIFHDINEETT